MTRTIVSAVFLSCLFRPMGAFPDYLYHSQNEEPFRSYPCLPQHIHLAQSTNVASNNNKVNMTVSFSLDYRECRNAVPSVLYGQGHQTTHQTAISQRPPLQFNYTSDKSRGLFRSNWIYHIEISEYRYITILPKNTIWLGWQFRLLQHYRNV